MRISSLVIGGVSSIAAAVAGIASYGALAHPSSADSPAVTVPAADQHELAPPVRIRFKPCSPGATLEHGACVTKLEKVVVAPGSRLGAGQSGPADDDSPSSAPSASDDGRDDDAAEPEDQQATPEPGDDESDDQEPGDDDGYSEDGGHDSTPGDPGEPGDD